MLTTPRQKEILNRIIGEYIDSAVPVSSHLIDEKYDFDVSPATLRIEMQKLTDLGYLCQPYTSAGRVPTDKGYRFFVDELFQKGLLEVDKKKKREISREIEKELDSLFKLINLATKVLADNSSNLGLSYLLEEEVLLKDGWEEIFEEPEFKDAEFTSNFAKTIDCFEKNIERVTSELSSEPRVYIGKESSLLKTEDFSLITSMFTFPRFKCEGFFAIIGPKRMNYDKNISIINSLSQLLKDY